MELDILHAIQSIHNGILDEIMVSLSTIGNRGAIWISIGLVFLCIKKYRKCGIVVLLSLFISVVFGNMILKNLIERPRPCWIDESVTLLIHNPKDFSFPSGHTYSSFAAAAAIFYHHKKIGIAALVLASLVGFSRLYLFVHFPTDVIGGMLLGIITAIVISKATDKYLQM